MSKKILFILICTILLAGCSALKNIGIKQTNDIIELRKHFNFENYLNEKIPLLNNNDLNEVKIIDVDDIKQVFYKKYEDARNYSYIDINNTKYDIGLLDLSDSDLENSRYILTKTQLSRNNYPIYKYYVIEGTNYLDSVYFQIIDNKPVIIMKIPFGFEFNSDKEIMTESVFGTPFTSSIYKWRSDGIYMLNLNDFFKADYVYFDSASKVINVIKKIDYQNPQNNKEEKFDFNMFDFGSDEP